LAILAKNALTVQEIERDGIYLIWRNMPLFLHTSCNRI